MNDETKNIMIPIENKTIIVFFSDKKLSSKKFLSLLDKDEINDTCKIKTNIDDFTKEFDKNHFSDPIGVTNEII